MPFARTDRHSAPASRSGTEGFGFERAAAPQSTQRPDTTFDISCVQSLLSAPNGYAAYAGIGSRETPPDILSFMTAIAEALEARGFTLRSGFAANADTAFELGTAVDELREIFAPWKGFGANPDSKWDKPRWDQIRAWETRTGRRFRPAKALLFTGELRKKAEALAAQFHGNWDRLSSGPKSLHTRNMGQVLGPNLDTPSRFLVCYTVDGKASGGTGQAIRTADAYGIPVLNLHDEAVCAEIVRVLGISGPGGSGRGHRSKPRADGEAQNPDAQCSTSKEGFSKGSVRYCSGSIVEDDADLLVNTVNCVSVMGKGVALEFKTRFPSIMTPYSEACRLKLLQPGESMFFPLPDGRQWAAIATKNHWRQPSQLNWVRSGLNTLAAKARAAGIHSIAVPPAGCTNGGLNWAEVEPILLEALAGFDLRIYGRPSQEGAR